MRATADLRGPGRTWCYDHGWAPLVVHCADIPALFGVTDDPSVPAGIGLVPEDAASRLHETAVRFVSGSAPAAESFLRSGATPAGDPASGADRTELSRLLSTRFTHRSTRNPVSSDAASSRT
ncbi:hypothetical protein GCM10022222_06390 [Amycolatopsis ultiminotia]|uniref:Uncharacterized protein n=1 Tax=Amycolatopsis ultiminotia TaxID=543629 RepID=A0ABP6V3C2_9PSEU